MIYFISAGISPFLGFAVDKLGRSVFWGTATTSVNALLFMSAVLSEDAVTVAFFGCYQRERVVM